MNRAVEELQEIEYHAARLLLLIKYCGSPATAPQIKGRTLLAKLDFFLRYPKYLEQAARIIKNKSLHDLIAQDIPQHELDNVETRMIRYKYGPWDNIYYAVLVYLIAKDLITVEIKQNVEHFVLTDAGQEAVQYLANQETFETIIVRAKALKFLFPKWSGTSVKDFIYTKFPEVVSLPLGKEI